MARFIDSTRNKRSISINDQNITFKFDLLARFFHRDALGVRVENVVVRESERRWISGGRVKFNYAK